jgi:hypothetical protein
MLSLFRINDLSRVIILALILVLIRLPFWISGVPASITDFQFRVLAEALSADRLIYAEVWHYTAPLSALFFQLIGEAFGKSFLAFQSLGFIFLFAQAIYFNNILNRLDAMKERTLIPALFYLFFGSLLFEFFALGPELIAMFPLLFALDLILLQIRFGALTERFFKIGFIFSIATLFYGPFFWLLPFFLLYFPFVFVMNSRRYGLFLSGFLFPILSMALYFHMNDALKPSLEQYVFEIFIPYQINYLDLQQYVLLFAVPMLLFLIAAFQSLFRSKFLNYQQSFNYFFLLLFPVSVIVLYFSVELSMRSFYIYIPILSFFAGHLYLGLRKRGINELIFSILLILTVFVNYGFAYKAFFNPEVVSLEKLLLKIPEEPKNQKVSVATGEHGYWYENSFAGPFLFEPFTSRFFSGEMDEDKIVKIHDIMKKEEPDMIIDTRGHFIQIMDRNILMSEEYERSAEGKITNLD